MVSTYPRSRPSSAAWLMALIVVAGLVLYAVSQHAIERHGSIAVTIYEQCQHSSQGSWRRPSDRRVANICQLDDGTWGIRIDSESGAPITSFARQQARTIADVVAYLRAQGYTKWIGRGVFP